MLAKWPAYGVFDTACPLDRKLAQMKHIVARLIPHFESAVAYVIVYREA
jgi:hypothetical protein